MLGPREPSENGNIQVHFCAAHLARLGEDSPCKLVGHTFRVTVTAESRSRTLRESALQAIRDSLSKDFAPLHERVLLADGGGNVAKFEGDEVIYISPDDRRYLFPVDDVFILPISEVTVESLANYLLKQTLASLREIDLVRENVAKISMVVDECFGSTANAEGTL